ncbi:Cysteine-rich receptor-like protein kinase 29, partial [Cucurbita argyrosperma subsp. argyrosperma]
MGGSRFICSITLSLLFLALIGYPLAFAQPRLLHFICVDGGNSNHTTDGAAYKANLEHLLYTFTTDHQIEYGFYNFSYGGENRAYAIGLCRGDISAEACRRCLNNSRDILLTRCETQKEALGWYDACMLRYSDRPILGSMEVSPPAFLWNTMNASDPEGFTEAARNLIVSLIGPTSAGDSRMKFAVGNATLPNLPTIYGSAQCTPDLSPRKCNECLSGALPLIQDCCDGKRGGRVLRPSCNFRYETYSFIQSPLPPPPPPPTLSPFPSPPSPPLLLNRTTHGNATAPTSRKIAPFLPLYPELLCFSGNKSSYSATFIAIVVPIAAVVVLALMISIYIFLRNCRPKPSGENYQAEEKTTTVGFLQFDFNTIRTATDEFSDENKLGEGGFGAVYKGKLPNKRIVAVKRLSKVSGQGDDEFKNELLLLSKLHHRNLVKLLGFSFKQNEKLLIYEFLQNGSLEKFIFDPLKRQTLNWAMRYKIIQDITRGLVYLHEDSRIKIIHRDLKPSNILLDTNMNAKISDFGTARLFASEQTRDDTSAIIGTFGYMAPEYARHGQFSSKSDVFSFGVLVLEIVTGRRNNRANSYNENIEDRLISSAWRNWREGTALNIVDPCVEIRSEMMRNEATRCIQIGLLCIQEKVCERPTMGTILLLLNGDLADFPTPSQPSFFMNTKNPPS